jgi:hypothetical protein
MQQGKELGKYSDNTGIVLTYYTSLKTALLPSNRPLNALLYASRKMSRLILVRPNLPVLNSTQKNDKKCSFLDL